MERSGRPRLECDGVGFGAMPYAGHRPERKSEPQMARGVAGQDWDIFSGKPHEILDPNLDPNSVQQGTISAYNSPRRAAKNEPKSALTPTSSASMRDRVWKFLFTSGFFEYAEILPALDPSIDQVSKPYDRVAVATKLRRALNGRGAVADDRRTDDKER